MNAAMTGADLVYHHHRFTGFAKNNLLLIEGQRRLNTEPALAKARIRVHPFEGTALLVGEAQTPEQKHIAETLIQDLPGIDEVVNRIVLAPVIATEQTLKDTWLSTKVRSQIVLRGDFDPDEISLVTENNTVYLMGALTEPHAQQAITLARETEGVERVVTLITYLRPEKHLFHLHKKFQQ